MPKRDNLLEKIWGLTQANSKKLTKISTHVAVLNSEMGGVQEEIRDIKNGYVTKTTFIPIQKIVYGMVGAILLAVVGAVLGLVILK